MKIRELIDIVEAATLIERQDIARTPFGEVIYFTNPSRQIAQSLVVKCNAIRGVNLGREFIIWDAGNKEKNNATHNMVGMAIFGHAPYHTFAVEKDGTNTISANWDNTEPSYWWGDFKVYGTESNLPMLKRWFPPSN